MEEPQEINNSSQLIETNKKEKKFRNSTSPSRSWRQRRKEFGFRDTCNATTRGYWLVYLYDHGNDVVLAIQTK